MNAVNTANLYYAAFPKSIVGQTANLYYTVYNSDGTVYLSRRQTGIQEYAYGGYGVLLTFSAEGSWSIVWDIENTPYTAKEEINIYDYTTAKNYTGYGIYADVIVNVANTLVFQYLLNNVPYDPYSVDKIEVYDDYTKAQGGAAGDVLETITSFTKTDTGKYQYPVAARSAAGTYFSRLYTTPVDGGAQFSNVIIPWYVRKVSTGPTPSNGIELCEIYFNIFDLQAQVTRNDNVYVELNKDWAWYNQELIKNFIETPPEIDDEGNVTFNAVETDTLDSSNTLDAGDYHYYEIRLGSYIRAFKVPKGTLSAHLTDLPEVTLCEQS